MLDCELRDGKNVCVGEVNHLHPGGDDSRPTTAVVFEVIERLSDHEGTGYLIAEIEVNTWWTNLPWSGKAIE